GDQKISQIETGVSGEWGQEAGIGGLETTEISLAVSGPDWQADMRSSGLSVKGSTADVSVSGSVQIDALAQGKALPSLDAVMSLNAGKEMVEAEVSGFAPWGAFGQLTARYPLGTEPASFAAHLDSALWDWQVLQSELSAIDAELAAVEVASLDFILNAEGQYDQSGLSATVSGEASDGYLSNDSVGLAGLAVQPFELRIQDDAFALVNSLSFSLEGISAGVPITDLTGTVDYDEGSWVLTHAEGKALGGKLIIDQFRDFSRDGPLGTVYLNDIDLAAVVEIAGTEGVSIQGRATAALPLIWQNGKILVDAGTLVGTPGALQYQPSIDPSQIDQRVGAVAAALSNLQFEQLDADITLNEEGVMFLSTSVLGSNPDYQNGRQVKLNLTLENNLLSLLKSLQTIESVNLWVTRKFEQQH
ncbi:MAG: intermembrane phospholipid transport protein YdbH family protein, partial [Luminiphilus sp.]